jgi:dodecin
LSNPEVYMSIARVVEITATSDESFEDALQQGVARATQTLRNVRSAWVKEQEVQIEGGQISGYKVNMLVTFVLDDNAELDDTAERGSGGARGGGRKVGGRRGRG